MLARYMAVSVLLSLAVMDEEATLEARFSTGCVVSRAAWADGRLHLLIRNGLHPDVGITVYVERDELYHRFGRLELLNACGIGTDPEGGLIEVTNLRTPGKAAALRFGVSNARTPTTVDSYDSEGLVSFLPSRPGSFISNSRIGNALAEFRSVPLSKRLVRFEGAADIGGDKVLAGTSAGRNTAPGGGTGALWWVDPVTGQVAPVNPHWATTTSREKLDDSVSVLDPQSDQVTGILADPRAVGWYYVAIGELYRGGRLVRVGPAGQCEIAFRRRSGPFRQIAGSPVDLNAPLGRSEEEGVLAIALDPQQVVNFVTPRGLYRLSGEDVEFVAAPQFVDVGGFYIARNVPGFVIVLSHQGTMAGQSWHTHLIPIPSQSAPATRQCRE